MPFDLKSWLTDLAAEGALTTEELGTLETALGKEKVLKRIEEGQLRQADYSRAMNALTEKEKATLDLHDQLVAWRDEALQKINASNLTARQEREARAVIEAKLKHAAEVHGLDLASLGVDNAAAPNHNAAGNNAGATGTTGATPAYVKEEDWKKEVGAMRATFPMLPALLHDLSVEHQVLFGKPLANAGALVQQALEKGKPLREVWEEQNKVAERRTEIKEQEIQARITAAVQAREAEVRSELNLPPAPRADARSPVLAEFKPPVSDKRELSAVDAAVAAYNEHKYAPDQGKAAA